MSMYRRSRWDQTAMALASISTVLISFVIIGATFTLWWPYTPLTRVEIAVEHDVRSGTELPVLIDYCKSSNKWVPSEIRWTLINDVMISIDGPKAALPEGCDPTREVKIQLSDHVPAGKYRLQMDAIYHAWPWREIVYSRRSQVFQVIKD